MDADYVAVVSDAKTDRFVMNDFFGPLFVTRLEVEKQFKGIVEVSRNRSNQLEVLVRRDDIHSAGFRLTQSAKNLVFIKNTMQGPAILGGSSGVLPYSGGITIYDVKLNDAAIRTFFSEKSLAKAKCHDI
ncbi:hypothetical protein [Acidovorax sp. SUPP2539]|uniref:hypothetical protein n=1 Tax=Acidovorax sp. SUPP2539 TaxID=2920878 RepID=UPI0023DE32AC|nr:hypothetical protein [Acidovorax sp. SUPP2539]GKS92219.1 hypothetical protein AVTE2539_22660 [Acidovorax sp. SUPP2539]